MATNGTGAFDIAVIGAGIAGASVAAELAPHASVILLEREDQPGYHTTGRSAAVFAESYGPRPIRALTRASAAFFEAPPSGFAALPLLSPRGIMRTGRADQRQAFEALYEELAADTPLERLDSERARRLVPILRAEHAAFAFVDPRGRDIDVAALVQGYLRAFRAAGGTLRTRAEVLGLSRSAPGWRIDTPAGEVRAATVVNAAGAWADAVGALAGTRSVGLVPKRRTAAIVAAPEGVDPRPWPIVGDCEETFYMKPEGGRLLISPADETPSLPCDAQPEELDVAICVERIEAAFDLRIRRIERKWAGLRSFVADKAPVCGYDSAVPGFFWLAGQGGYGIQTAPALSRLAAALVRGEAVPADIEDHGLDVAELAPERRAARG